MLCHYDPEVFWMFLMTQPWENSCLITSQIHTAKEECFIFIRCSSVLQSKILKCFSKCFDCIIRCPQSFDWQFYLSIHKAPNIAHPSPSITAIYYKIIFCTENHFLFFYNQLYNHFILNSNLFGTIGKDSMFHVLPHLNHILRLFNSIKCPLKEVKSISNLIWV